MKSISQTSAGYARVKEAFSDAGLTNRGNYWQCPVRDHGKDLKVRVKASNGKADVQCYAGCDVKDVANAVGLNLRDLYDQPIQSDYDHAAIRQLANQMRQRADSFTWPDLRTGEVKSRTAQRNRLVYHAVLNIWEATGDPAASERLAIAGRRLEERTPYGYRTCAKALVYLCDIGALRLVATYADRRPSEYAITVERPKMPTYTKENLPYRPKYLSGQFWSFCSDDFGKRLRANGIAVYLVLTDQPQTAAEITTLASMTVPVSRPTVKRKLEWLAANGFATVDGRRYLRTDSDPAAFDMGEQSIVTRQANRRKMHRESFDRKLETWAKARRARGAA